MNKSTHKMRYSWYGSYDKNVPFHIDYPNINLNQLFDAAVQDGPSRQCLIYNGEILTYSDVQKYIEVFSRKLMIFGVKPGDRVGLILPNCPKFVIAFFAILKIGGVVTAINPLATSFEMQYQLKDSEVKLIVGDIQRKENIQDALQTTAANIVLFEDTRLSNSEIEEIYSISENPLTVEKAENLADHENSFRYPSVYPETPAIFQYTGGTTGMPKAAIATHYSLVANVYQFSTWLTSLEPGQETWLSVIPFYHVYGMVIGLCVAIQKRAALVVLPDARDIQAVITAAIDYRATFLPGVPALFSSVIHYLESTSRLQENFAIKTCISGSASLHEKIKNRFEELTGSRILEGYGLSEAPTATHCNPLQGENRIGSIGLPLPDVICKLVDLESGLDEVAPGEPGELVLRSPQVMLGYHNPGKGDAQIIKDGWLFTGDVARMDNEGYFFLVDRKRDLIKVGGFQVWPKEVEVILMEHAGVAEAAVSGRKRQEDAKEIVVAWVVLNPGIAMSVEELQIWCSQKLSRYKIPKEIHFVDSLPKSTVGKVLRRKLREKIS